MAGDRHALCILTLHPHATAARVMAASYRKGSTRDVLLRYCVFNDEATEEAEMPQGMSDELFDALPRV